MKSRIKLLGYLLMLTGSFGSMLAGRATAQTFTTLHSFTSILSPFPGPNTNSDGVWPNRGLVLSANTLYGTTQQGGGGGYGTVFAVNSDAGVLRHCMISPIATEVFRKPD